jgi:O-antigen/teichoic acid export membrane protein
VTDNLGRSYVLATYGLAVQGGSRFAFTVIVGRELGVEMLGVVTTLLAVGVFASLFWPTSAGLAASRYLAQFRRGQRTTDATSTLNHQVLVSSAAIGLATCGVGFAVSGDISLAVGCGASSVAYAAYVYGRGAQLGLGRVSWVAAWDTVCGVVILGGTLAVVQSAESMLLLPLAVGYGIFALACWPRPARDAAQTSWRDPLILRFVGANVVAQLAGGGIVNLAMLMAHAFGTPTETGLFAAAFSLATPALMLGQSLQQVLVPHFSHDHTRDERRRDLRRVVLRLAAPMALVFLGLIAVTPVLLRVFYGTEYAGASGQMRWLLAGVMVASVGLVPAAALIASAHTRPLVRASLVGCAIGIALMLTLGPALGTWAAVVGYGVGVSVTGVLALRAAWVA